ncbi:MAG TPA: TlpA disulfide reductase family protein [Puia sp.]|nr:TlpA disulfide reductase family protein [Puia sp.]
MKQFFTICAVVIFLIQGCQSPTSPKTASATTDSTYIITGKISGLDTGLVYLFNRQSDSEKLDSAIIKNGSFTFTGKADSPQFCMLGFQNNGHREYQLGFFVQNGHLNISAKKDSLSDADVTGSPAQEEYKNFLTGKKNLEDEEGKLDKVYETLQLKGDKRGMDSVEKFYELLEKKKKDFVKDYVKKNPSSYVSSFAVYQSFSFNPEAAELDSLYNQLSLSIQQSYFGKKIKDVLDIARKTAVGNRAPEFTQNDASGKSISLASFKGKYVLVDFWASWCGPCRAENPNVVKAYSKYHRKGFDILGVSLDEKKDKWEEAIKKDNLNWSQVSDLQGWKNSVAALYGIQGIPMNFLIDKDGKIVARGLRGEDLDKKLDEMLK